MPKWSQSGPSFPLLAPVVLVIPSLRKYGRPLLHHVIIADTTHNQLWQAKNDLGSYLREANDKITVFVQIGQFPSRADPA
jgi:hypothetical protein